MSFSDSEMAPSSVIITGANRGIGLGLVRQFLKNSRVNHVIATARNVDKAEELQKLSDPRLHLVSLDVDNDKSINTFYDKVNSLVGDKGLNVLVNNAGISVQYKLKEEPDREAITRQLQTNTISVVCLTQKLLPLLTKAASATSGDQLSISRAAVLNISSGLGSIGENDTGSGPVGFLAYRISKAGVNMFTRTLAIDVKNDGILVTSFCPGWVQTDMGGPKAALTVDESAEALVNSFSKLTNEHSGNYYSRHMKPFGW